MKDSNAKYVGTNILKRNRHQTNGTFTRIHLLSLKLATNDALWCALCLIIPFTSHQIIFLMSNIISLLHIEGVSAYPLDLHSELGLKWPGMGYTQ